MPQVVAAIDDLDGKTVRVQGYLGTCAGYDCELFVNQADRNSWLQGKGSREQAYKRIAYLSIGSAIDFDRKAAPLQNRKVMITGTVSNHCRRGFFGFFKRNVCTDRADDIRPIDITALKET